MGHKIELIVSLQDQKRSNLHLAWGSSSKIMLYVVDIDLITIPELMMITVRLGAFPLE